MPAPLGFIGVAGLYRTGKSYLLNRMLLDRSDGFGVGPTINPCTKVIYIFAFHYAVIEFWYIFLHNSIFVNKGLWIWGTPIKGKDLDGNSLNIIVIDSEGIGALDENSTHDSRLFSLVVLLSSCFIYNSLGSIDENAI